jgi:predicted DCC family thiol-disulfide oxidoreductase YuxK
MIHCDQTQSDKNEPIVQHTISAEPTVNFDFDPGNMSQQPDDPPKRDRKEVAQTAFHPTMAPRQSDLSSEPLMKQGVPLPPHEWDRFEHLIVFDGVCKFCNAFVNFVLKRDHARAFKFGTLQSPPAQRILQHFHLSTHEYETFLLIERGALFTKSTGALHILRRLGFPWSLLWLFILVPRPIRDLGYDFIARHRYRWMGRRDSCRLPEKEEKDRFVS